VIAHLDGSLSDYSATASALKGSIIADIARESGVLQTQVAVALSAGSIVVVATLPSAGASVLLRKYQQKSLGTLGGLKVVNLTPFTGAPGVILETLAKAAAAENGTAVTSPINAKAIAGGIGGAVAVVLLVVGAVILRKTCRKLKEKDAAKPDASAHELQRKDRPESLKLAAGASLGMNAPQSRLVTAGRYVQVGRERLRLRPPLRFRPDSMQRWRLPRRSARYAPWSLGVLMEYSWSLEGLLSGALKAV
jgi:hypothetical protein